MKRAVFCLRSFPSFSFRNSVKLHPALSLTHCSLQVNGILYLRFSFSPLLSSRSLHNLGELKEAHLPDRCVEEEVVQVSIMAACWHSASSSWTHPPDLLKTGGSITSLADLYWLLGCFPPVVPVYLGWHSVKWRKEPRKRLD